MTNAEREQQIPLREMHGFVQEASRVSVESCSEKLPPREYQMM